MVIQLDTQHVAFVRKVDKTDPPILNWFLQIPQSPVACKTTCYTLYGVWLQPTSQQNTCPPTGGKALAFNIGSKYTHFSYSKRHDFSCLLLYLEYGKLELLLTST